MNRMAWILVLAVAGGCINGAPLPPTPTSSLSVSAGASNGQLQEAEYVQIARTYLTGQGQDATQATYTVHRTPHRADDASPDGPDTIAVVDANFLNGNVWHLAIKDNGEIAPLSGR
jgi:hypothetical protein